MSDQMSGTSGTIVTISDMMVTSAKYLGKRGRNSRKPHTVRYWTDDGKQREASYSTDREAIDARDRMLARGRHAASNLTFAEAFEAWLPTRGLKPGTVRRYRSVYREHLGGLAPRKLADVASDPNAVQALAWVPAGKVVLLIVCGVAAWAQTGGLISDNRLVRSTMRHGTVRRVRAHVPYSADQLAAITDYLGRDGIVAQVMHGTGCRVSEALALTAQDFTGEHGSYRVAITRQRDRDTGRDVDLKVSGKSHTAPVSDGLYRTVREHALRYGTGSGRLADCSYGRFARRLRLACERAGVFFTAHNFRHDYALRLYRAGVPVADIARYMGDTVETIMATYLNHPSAESDAIARSALN